MSRPLCSFHLHLERRLCSLLPLKAFIPAQIRPAGPKAAETGRLAIVVVISGCASFEPRLHLHDVSGDRTSTVKAEQESLEIAIEEFVPEEKSRQVFDADIGAQGVMANSVRAHTPQPTTKTISLDEIKRIA